MNWKTTTQVKYSILQKTVKKWNYMWKMGKKNISLYLGNFHYISDWRWTCCFSFFHVPKKNSLVHLFLNFCFILTVKMSLEKIRRKTLKYRFLLHFNWRFFAVGNFDELWKVVAGCQGVLLGVVLVFTLIFLSG